MGDKSKISWTDATWNPVVGCTKASEGCAHCYAERDHNKRHKAYCEGKLQNVPQYSKPFNQVQLIESRLDQPLRWKRPRKVFVNSQSDLFHPDVPFELIDKVFAIMGLCTQHTFQVLTKRPERAFEYFDGYKTRVNKELDKLWADSTFRKGTKGDVLDWMPTFPLPNVWLGVTAENQKQADIRIPILLSIQATIKFVSIEPMLGPIDLTDLHYDNITAIDALNGLHGFPKPHAEGPKLDLVICGGESGSNARPMHPDWARSLRDQCTAAGVPFFFKQWGEYVHDKMYDGCRTYTFPDGTLVFRVGTKKAGNILDGQTWQQMPEVA